MLLASHRASSAVRAVALASALLLTIGPSPAHAAVTLGFVDHFSGTSTGTWAGGNGVENPGAGGALGPTDGYLRVSTPGMNSNLGATGTAPDYNGNWVAAGINLVRLKLNDVDANDPLELHFGIGTTENFWQYNTGFIPPEQAWGDFAVDLSSSAAFTQIINLAGGTYNEALTGAVRVLVRHDLAPYVQTPNPLDGDFGLDEVLLTNSIVGVDIPAARGIRPVQVAAPYPNPSRGAVALSLQTYADEAVRIEVVDVAGRLVRQAALAAAPAGTRLWTWDGRDDAGGYAPAGVYRVRAFGPSGGTSRPLVRLGR